MRLADTAGLTALAEDRLTVSTDKGANPGAKITTLIAGMVAGADSIADMDILRHGGMSTIFNQIYAPSTLGSFLRSYAFGHVRQFDAVASRFLTGLAAQTPNLVPATDGYIFVDVDDTIIEVHGYKKQGAGFGYLRDTWTQRPAGHSHHPEFCPGDRGPTIAERIMQVASWCQAPDRRCGGHHPAFAGDGQPEDPSTRGFCILWISEYQCRDQGRCGGVRNDQDDLECHTVPNGVLGYRDSGDRGVKCHHLVHSQYH
ncbi:hypothetical protein CFAEC_05290 [Corynebacterium faecale]|nr:hypothetical protein CFAEC_05290 [Corynebacterium faecale]